MSKTYTAPAAFSAEPYVAIRMTPVESKQIAAIGYDAARQRLSVTFTRGVGAVYQYIGVSPEVHAAFMAAESKGKFFDANVRAFPFEKHAGPVAA